MHTFPADGCCPLLFARWCCFPSLLDALTTPWLNSILSLKLSRACCWFTRLCNTSKSSWAPLCSPYCKGRAGGILQPPLDPSFWDSCCHLFHYMQSECPRFHIYRARSKHLRVEKAPTYLRVISWIDDPEKSNSPSFESTSTSTPLSFKRMHESFSLDTQPNKCIASLSWMV